MREKNSVHSAEIRILFTPTEQILKRFERNRFNLFLGDMTKDAYSPVNYDCLCLV